MCEIVESWPYQYNGNIPPKHFRLLSSAWLGCASLSNNSTQLITTTLHLNKSLEQNLSVR